MCVEGECVGVSPNRYDLQAVCEKNYPGSKLVQTQAPDECLKIRCRLTKDGATTQYSLHWPPVDGSHPCGPAGSKNVSLAFGQKHTFSFHVYHNLIDLSQLFRYVERVPAWRA